MKLDCFLHGERRNPAAWLPFLVLAVLLLTVHSGLGQTLDLLGGDSGDDEEESSSHVSRKMHLDMMYGTDDYFGENTDLSYADRVTPSGKTSDTSSQETIVTSADEDDDDDDDDDKDDDKDDDGGSSGGDDPDDGGDDPGGGGDDPPPPPPPPPDDGDCPD